MKPLQIGEVSFDLDIDDATAWNDTLKLELTNFIREALEEIEIPDAFQPIETLEFDLGVWSNTKDGQQKLRQLLIGALNKNIKSHEQEKIVQPYPKSEISQFPVEKAIDEPAASIRRFEENEESDDLRHRILLISNQIWNTPQSSTYILLNQWAELFKLMDIPALKIRSWMRWWIGLNHGEKTQFQTLLNDFNLDQIEKKDWEEILSTIYQTVYNGSLIDLLHTPQRNSIIDEIIIKQWKGIQIPFIRNSNIKTIFNGLNPSQQPHVILDILSRLGDKLNISNWAYWILIHLDSAISNQEKIQLIKRIEKQLKSIKAPVLISDAILNLLPPQIKHDWIQYISNQENIVSKITELKKKWFERFNELTPIFNHFLEHYQISQNEFNKSFSAQKWIHLIPVEQELLKLIWNNIYRLLNSQSSIEWSWNFTLGFRYILQAIEEWNILNYGFDTQESADIIYNQIEPNRKIRPEIDTNELQDFSSWLQEKNEIKETTEIKELMDWFAKVLDWEKRKKSQSDDFAFEDTKEFYLFLQRFNKEEIINLYKNLTFDLTPSGLINLWLEELLTLWGKIQTSIQLGKFQKKELKYIEDVTQLIESLKEVIIAIESSNNLYVVMLSMYHNLIPFMLELTKSSFIPQTKLLELQKLIQEVFDLSNPSNFSDQIGWQNESTLHPIHKYLYSNKLNTSSFRLIPLEIRKILLILYNQLHTQDAHILKQINNFAEYISAPDYLWFSLNRTYQILYNSEPNPSIVYKLIVITNELFEVISIETPKVIREFIQRMISSSLDELSESEKDKIDLVITEQQAESYFQTSPSEDEQRVEFVKMANQKISFDSIVNSDILGLALIAQDEEGPTSNFQEISENLNAHKWWAKLRAENNQGYYQLSQVLGLKKVVDWVSKRYTYQWILGEDSIWEVHRYLRVRLGLAVALKFLSQVKFRLMMLDSPKTKLDWALILTEEIFLIQSLNLRETKNWLEFLKKNYGFELSEMMILDEFVQPRLKKRISTNYSKLGVQTLESIDSPNNYKYLVDYIFSHPLLQPSEVRNIIKSLEMVLTIEHEDLFWDEIIRNANATLRNEEWNSSVKTWVKTQIKAWISTAKKPPILKDLSRGDDDFWSFFIKKLSRRDILEIIHTSDYIHPFFEIILNSASKEITLVDIQNKKSDTNPIESPKIFEQLHNTLSSLDWVNPKVESSLFLTIRKINRAIEAFLDNTEIIESDQTLDLNNILFKSLSDNIQGELDLLLHHLINIAINNDLEYDEFIKHIKPWMEQLKSLSLGSKVLKSQGWITELTDKPLLTWLEKIHALIERLWYDVSTKTEIHKDESAIYRQVVSHLKHEIASLSQQDNIPQFFHLTTSDNIEQHWAAFENRVSQKFEQNELFWQPIRVKLANIFDDNQILLLEEFTKKLISRVPDAQEDLFLLMEEIANKYSSRKEIIIRESFIPKIMGWLIQSGIESHAGMSHLLWVSSMLSLEVLPNTIKDIKTKLDFHELEKKLLRPYLIDIFKGRVSLFQEEIVNILQQIDDDTTKMLEQKISYEFNQKHKKPNAVSKIVSSDFQALFDSEIPLVNELKSNETGHIKDEEIKKEIDRGTRFKTANCGLMLLAPFYSTLFRRLDWVEKQEFKSEREQVKAYRLLLYIAELNMSDDKKNQGNQDLIARIISGIPAENEITILEDISESDQEEAQTFLKAVIGQWPIMVNASLEGFVESFLQRGGIAFKSEDKWNIEVEGRGTDIILKTLPWGYGTMKFPWAPYIVYTIWEIP